MGFVTGNKSAVFKHGDVMIMIIMMLYGIAIGILTINDDSAQFITGLLHYIHSIPKGRFINEQNMGLFLPVKQFRMHVTVW
jgi:hypothetical protein